MEIERILGYTLGALIVVGGVLVLGAIARFSIISPRRTRGARSRLRKPDVRGVSDLCGFELPKELGAFYRQAPFLERTEYELVDCEVDPPRRWMIGEFIPLTVRDATEARKVFGVGDVPLADDADKGVYCMDREGRVLLRSPNVAGQEVIVAERVEQLLKFEVASMEPRRLTPR